MNLALIGHGKMGREVEAIAKEKGCKVVEVFTRKSNSGGIGLTAGSLKGIDVCIDFSTPVAVMDNIEAVIGTGTSMVVGTTGWYDKIDHVRKLVKNNNTGFLYASNFSLGVNVFTQVVMDAAHLFDKYPEYDVAIAETHHKAKADSPSGTALSLGQTILHEIKRKSELLTDAAHSPIQPNQLHITSSRIGHVTGTHTVLFDSEWDSIQLTHTAKGRKGFALGAVVAAQWLAGKKGFYTMRDVILP